MNLVLERDQVIPRLDGHGSKFEPQLDLLLTTFWLLVSWHVQVTHSFGIQRVATFDVDGVGLIA